jgi:hypothetical protein
MTLPPNVTSAGIASPGDQSSTVPTWFKKAWQLLALVINGHVSFGDGTTPSNVDGVWVSVATGSSNPFTVTHNLGRVPVGYLVAQKDAAVDIYGGKSGWTSSVMQLNATVVSVPVLLFVF